MTALVNLRLEGPVDQLRLAWQAGETVLSGLAFAGDAQETRYHILLAMQELLTNVLRHGYGREAEELVSLEFVAEDRRFEFEIRDRAPRFDPTAPAAQPVLDAGGTPPEGGYGLAIVQSVMDELIYRREDGWNVVRAVKSVGVGAAVGASEEPS